jgi:hypothetical protein
MATGYNATHVRVVDPQGVEKIYPMGRGWNTDGFGDYIVIDGEGNNIAQRRRGSVDEIEVIYAEVSDTEG